MEKALYKVRLNFDLLPDKQIAWDDLGKLTSSEEKELRDEVLKTLIYVLSDVLDKDKIWKNLIILLKSSDIFDLRTRESQK